MVFRRDVGFVRSCPGDSFFGGLVVCDSVVVVLFHGEEYLCCYAQVFKSLFRS